MQRTSIALIGGGAAATLFLAHLAAHDDLPPLSVMIFDRAGRFGTGIAYGTQNSSHLLNVRASDMSALHHDQEHFTRWLAGRKPGGTAYGPHDFAPRLVYGQYLRDVLSRSVHAAESQGHAVIMETADISGMAADPAHAGWHLSAAGEREWKAARVLLATGNARPTAPSGARELSPAQGYHNDPWQTDYAALADTDHIIVLGTGLSMVDAVVSLDTAGFRGRVTAVSRNGLMPAVHSEMPCGTFPVAAHGPPAPTAMAYMRFVRAHARAAQAQGLSWQAAVSGLRPVTNEWWLRLPEGEQRKLRRALPFWSVHRHRTAPVPGRLVKSWHDSGRLKIVRGRVLRVYEAAGGVAVDCGKVGNLTASHVVNCLGYGCHPASAFPVTGAAGGEETLYGIGPSLCDRLVETVAIPEIRKTAADLAENMAAQLRACGRQEKAHTLT